jgi:hypothetical protein
MTTAINRSYDLANWPEVSSVLERATTKMCEQQRSSIKAALTDNTFSNLFQVQTGDQRRMFSVADLCASASNETSQQRIDSKAVSDVLFGANGLISGSNAKRNQRLMEDIEVAFIIDVVNGIEIGPIITSGRNRLISLQILLKAAAPNASLQHVNIRCSTIHLTDRSQVESRIVSANMGSRKMALAENRERFAGGQGLNTSSRDALIASLPIVANKKVYPAAFGALVKLCAIERGLNGLTIDQYAASGVTTFNALNKANKGLSNRIDEDTTFLVQLADSACNSLQQALPEVMASTSRGAKSHKMAKILVRRVAEQHQLSVQS